MAATEAGRRWHQRPQIGLRNQIPYAQAKERSDMQYVPPLRSAFRSTSFHRSGSSSAGGGCVPPRKSEAATLLPQGQRACSPPRALVTIVPHFWRARSLGPLFENQHILESSSQLDCFMACETFLLSTCLDMSTTSSIDVTV